MAKKRKLPLVALLLIGAAVVSFLVTGPSGLAPAAYLGSDVASSPLFNYSLDNSINELEGENNLSANAGTAVQCSHTPGCSSGEERLAIYIPTTGYSCGATCGSTCGSTCSVCPTMGSTCRSTYCVCPTMGSTCSSTCGTNCKLPTVDSLTCSQHVSCMKIPTVDASTCYQNVSCMKIPTVNAVTCSSTCAGRATCGSTCSGRNCGDGSTPTVDAATCGKTCSGCSTNTVKKLTASPKSLTLGTGETGEVFLTVTYKDKSTEDVTGTATWTSTKPDVAAVSGGKITGVADGKAVIVAKFGAKTARITVKVLPAESGNEGLHVESIE